MPVTRTRIKYYLLSLLGTLVIALGVLAVAASAQAQQEPPPAPPTLDKECTPNPVQVGQTLTCSFTVTLAPRSGTIVTFFADTFPSGIRPISVLDPRCMVDGQTVTCPGVMSTFTTIQDVPEIFLLNTVDAIAEQCGTFRNTASIAGEFGGGIGEPLLPFTAADTEEITVEGCEEEAGGGGGGGGAAPITQEGEQESEAGEIDQTFDVS